MRPPPLTRATVNIATESCVRCGGTSTLVGVYEPPVGTKVALYGICDGCVQLPDVLMDLEDRIHTLLGIPLPTTKPA